MDSSTLRKLLKKLRREPQPRQRWRHALERLESRQLLSAVPWGAAGPDTGEYMLGSTLVTVVFMESNGAIDPSTEDWTPALINATKQKVQAGIEWWEETLANVTPIHSLDFQFDFTFADNPVPTRYEPISRISDQYTLWVNDFLDFVGFNSPRPISEDIRAFNHAQRQTHDTNWAFTIFVANATNDLDGQFAAGGSFPHAFAFAGGRFFVAPSTRPASTFTHETGHLFWGRDEYLGGGSWLDRRGYYDTQNLNAADNPTPGFVQQDSIMANGTWLVNAFNNHTSAASTLEMLGWRDSDGNGVFDVLDVSHTLRGSGRYDSTTGRYRLVGEALVNTLPNRNSSGLQNDITINRITRAEYRINGGNWITAANYDTYTTVLDLSIPVPAANHQIEIRTVTIDPGTQQLVTASPIYVGSTQQVSETGAQGIHGSLWNDLDADGEWDPREIGLAGRTVQLVDQNGLPVTLQNALEPDAFDDTAELSQAFDGVTLATVGLLTASDDVVSRTMSTASTGDRVFAHFLSGSATSPTWTKDFHELQATFANLQTFVSIDAIGDVTAGYARLEAYDGAGNLLERYNTGLLDPGQVETMVVSRPVAEIRSIKAFGRTNSAVLLDNLRVGHSGQTKSTSTGAYWLEDLPAGTYFVETVAPTGSLFTAPLSGRHQVTLNSGDEASGRHFGVQPVFGWQNPNLALDVNNDQRVTPFDASLVLAELVRNSTRELPPPTDGLGPAPFWDARGDNILSPFDVLLILRELANQGNGESAVGRATGSNPTSSTAGDAESEEGEPAALGLPPPLIRKTTTPVQQIQWRRAAAANEDEQRRLRNSFWAQWGDAPPLRPLELGAPVFVGPVLAAPATERAEMTAAAERDGYGPANESAARSSFASLAAAWTGAMPGAFEPAESADSCCCAGCTSLANDLAVRQLEGARPAASGLSGGINPPEIGNNVKVEKP